jgi:ABC-2 type transport system ATP-binding protein
MSAIEVTGLTKRFGSKTVVDHVDLRSRRRDRRLPRAQRLRQDDDDPHDLRPAAPTPAAAPASATTSHPVRADQAEVGYMTQRFSFYEDLTIARTSISSRGSMTSGRAERLRRRTLDRLGLTTGATSLPATLSGGWKQRLALAACIMHEPSCCCSTSPPPASTRRRGASSGTRSTGSPRRPDRAGLHPLHGRGRALPPHRLHRLRHDDRTAARSTEVIADSSGLSHLDHRGEGAHGSAGAPALAAGRRRAGGAVRQRPARRRHRSGVPPRAGASRGDRRDAGRIRRRTGETSLEDVFIRLMAATPDNFANGGAEGPGP